MELIFWWQEITKLDFLNDIKYIKWLHTVNAIKRRKPGHEVLGAMEWADAFKQRGKDRPRGEGDS